MSHAYDSDDGPRSPGLEPSKPNYGVEDQLPPFFRSSMDNKGTSSDSSRKSQPNLPGSGIAQGSAVLINHLDRNRPDVAEYEINNPMRREFTPEDGDDFARMAQNAAQNALKLLPSESSASKDNAPKHDPPMDGNPIQEPQHEQGPPPQLPPPLPSIGATRREPLSLKQLASNQDLLPAIQQPPSVFSKSPENQHSLPPLQSALPELSHVPPKDSRVNGVSPYSLHPITGPSPRAELPREYQIPGPPQAPLSPYSTRSPASSKDPSTVPSPVSQPTYKRPAHKPTIPYVTSPYDVPSHAKSPITSYPTPTDPPTTGSYGDVSVNGAVPGSFKCPYPGCTAPPFQTQYLLNSHTNVHSQDRPHYCPIEGCPRGPGGKGFKRKNEMIRHGLVHNSPGYVCPFCPGQQHRYPRPDNLQRHVRVHHVDKGKDDPDLRHVLSQRPEGSARGRRRRTNTSH